MSVPNITRKFEFDSGHRVLGHEGKCRYLHGHRYVCEVTACALELDNLGRVIDFGVMKDRVGSWIDANLDHNMILNPNDPLLADMDEAEKLIGCLPFVMPEDMPNPTAENIVRVIGSNAARLLLKESIRLVRVRLYETPNCWADWENPTFSFFSEPINYRAVSVAKES